MIFGTSYPKFYDTDLSAEVLLDNSIIVEHTNTSDYAIQNSELDSSKAYSPRGTSWIVKIKVHLSKFANPLTTFTVIVGSFKHKVNLFLHEDGNAFKNGDGDDALFLFSEVEMFELPNGTRQDILILTFQSMDAIVRMSPGSPT